MELTWEEQLDAFIKAGLYEDIREGDHTSLACIPADARGKARLLVKDEGIIAGVDLASRIFRHIDPSSRMEILIPDGQSVKYGDVAFYVEAGSQQILMAERLVLNSMQRLSGIATLSRQFADAVKAYPVTILDTRKTTPLLRFLEKWAVRIGGATNYRYGLYDRIMIKDNHVDFCGSLPAALDKVHAYLRENQLNLEITVEVRNLEELDQAMRTGGFQRVMLDNFTPERLKEAISLVGKRFETEASGGINLGNVEAYAATGVNFISVGALTHSYQSLDLSLKSVK